MVFLVATGVLMHIALPPDLTDGVEWICSPKRRVGADPERIGPAVSTVLLPVPSVVGAVAELRDAAPVVQTDVADKGRCRRRNTSPSQ